MVGWVQLLTATMEDSMVIEHQLNGGVGQQLSDGVVQNSGMQGACRSESGIELQDPVGSCEASHALLAH